MFAVKEEELKSIADAIREVSSHEDTMLIKEMPDRIKYGEVLDFMTTSKSEYKVQKSGGIVCDGLILDNATRDTVAFDFEGRGIKIIARAVGNEGDGDVSIRLSLHIGGVIKTSSTGVLFVSGGQRAKNAFELEGGNRSYMSIFYATSGPDATECESLGKLVEPGKYKAVLQWYGNSLQPKLPVEIKEIQIIK